MKAGIHWLLAMRHMLGHLLGDGYQNVMISHFCAVYGASCGAAYH